ncbi:MAG: hypothetical protein HY347_08575 [candidate division NC10 bacterium]|nr:hypothetical protein [candidate division NC10 bacterium]
MTKRVSILTSLGILVLVGGLLLQGCKGKEEQAQAPAPPTAAAPVSGEVVSVDATANTVVVKDATGAQKTFSLDPATTISKDGTTLTLAELTAGTKVEVQSEQGAEGKLIAKAITVKP